MEDLNLYRMKVGIIKRCWFDKRRFPKLKDICEATGLTERSLHRWAHDLNLPKRTGDNLQMYFFNNYLKTNQL